MTASTETMTKNSIVFTRTFTATDDCNLASQCAQTITMLSGEADVGIRKDDGQTSVSQGQLATYTIIAGTLAWKDN